MSLFYDAARQYLAESYDLHLAEQHDTEYAFLTPEGVIEFNVFVDARAAELAARLREACEVYMADADALPEEVWVPARLEYLRGCIRAESISYGEVAELQGLADHIEAGDVELAEWAGIPEDEFMERGR